ncbi:DsbA family protein [Deinococcus maricopensis]|uniref:DSBA oxidoreductase n=1 Tax=Deinococcus maricopensis (strain DSM 21211 / LMG 22137 / NRRL B-23946 / LB-34) TaxID=709986 RepID=E8U6U7_DEIML|nr:thioredoxin domain-containing protein [Deinococcus maricopensis]ADV66786.1 DSBA oxidoreductase [Deinococcus maricopensis DSM 21211]
MNRTLLTAALSVLGVAAAQVAYPASNYARLTGGTAASATASTTSVRVGGGTVTVTTAGGLAARFAYSGPTDDTASAARALIATETDMDAPVTAAQAKQLAGAFDKIRAQVLGKGPVPLGFADGLDFTLDWTASRLTFTVAPHEYTGFGADRYVLGKGGPVIREFSDFQCPYCRELHDDVFPALQRDLIGKGLARFSYRHFPLSFHQNAMPLALGGECAAQQGKFWAYHDVAFTVTSPVTAAKQLGLNLTTFQTCLKDPAVQALVKADMKVGDAVDVQGTPSLYVGPFKVQNWTDAASIGNYVKLVTALGK